MTVKTILIFFFIINALGFLIMQIDKNNAINGKSRVSEASIFTVAAIGGSIGVAFGMYLLRHKTKKKKFTVGIPIIILLQILIVLFI